jgi:hypothetical protein
MILRQQPAVHSSAAVARRLHGRLDALMGCIVFLVCFLVFRIAPIQQAGDSRYTMLLAENLLRHGDFALERYDLPPSDYRIQDVGGHRYYSFPPGSSILSVPFVAAMHLRGISAVRPDGTYNITGELALDSKLAFLLMAAFATIVYFTARLVLPIAWCVAITLVSAFGTQVFSTTSRSMWSDTWGIVLVSAGAFLLLRSTVQAKRPDFTLLATLDAWAYIVRPTNALVLAGTVCYGVLLFRKEFVRFPLVVAGWLALFFSYSWSHFGRLVPDYYAPDRLRLPTTAAAVLGNLISPSRGLLVYVPAVVATSVLLIRYRRSIRFRPVACLAGAIMIGHLSMLSGFEHWWGGHSYGARLTASIVPWIVILAILSVDAMRTAGPGCLLCLIAAILCLCSISINAVGAFSLEAAKWNLVPDNIDFEPERLWSWRRPQFLAPYVEPDGRVLPLPIEGLRVGSSGAERYLGLGWAWGDGDSCWTDSPSATIRLSLQKGTAGAIELELRPYLAPPKLSKQRLTVSMNGVEIGNLVLDNQNFVTYSFAVRADVPEKENSLRLRVPDAESPASNGRADDRRLLGVEVRLLRWRPESG